MERAGIDIITDGEMRRESYSNRFATALEGIDNETPATITNRAGRSVKVPRVIGKIRRRHAVEVGDMAFLRRNTERKAKITLPGPFTMAQQAKNEFYDDDDEMVMDLAAAVNAEAHDLQAAGADVIQLDEPWVRNDPEAAQRIAVKAIDRALLGLSVTPRWCTGTSRVVIRSCRSSRTARPRKSRSRPRSRSSTSAFSPTLPARPSFSVSSTSATRRSNRPSRWRNGSATR
jgi:5-methyltetrahydropteroyltriglutamate--homocysteine methyltransferase